jgi:transcriptional regulator with XRE-family HTH domain
VRETRFADALRGWRARRRLSQLELATRTDTTQRHLSFMESGRSVPGRGMVVRLAESLSLPLRERNGLLLAAGYAPSYPEADLADPSVAPLLAGIRRLVEAHQPFPALVVNRQHEVVVANAAVSVLTAGAAPELLEPPVNVLRLALHPRGMAPRIANLAEWAQHILERLRQDFAQTGDERLVALREELTGYLPPRPAPDGLGFAVPFRLATAEGEVSLLTAITTFATATDVTISELKLETFLPADESSAAALTRLAASNPAVSR